MKYPAECTAHSACPTPGGYWQVAYLISDINFVLQRFIQEKANLQDKLND
jgi:hypothetical protein